MGSCVAPLEALHQGQVTPMREEVTRAGQKLVEVEKKTCVPSVGEITVLMTVSFLKALRLETIVAPKAEDRSMQTCT